MKAIFIEKYGGNEVLCYGEQPKPSPVEKQVLVEVFASSVNPIDWKTCQGKTKAILPYQLPVILGSDVSGVVSAIGPEVSKFRPGDEVFARIRKSQIGAFAEYAIVEEEDLAKKPFSLSHKEAASIPLVGLTAWQALLDQAKLTNGQKVLIHAGAGGVGSFAIQLAKHMGAFVATTASSPKHEWVRKLGADLIIDYQNQRFEDLAKEYDIVFDTLGGETLTRSFTVIKPGGHLVTIAGMPEPSSLRRFGASPLIVFVGWAANIPNYWKARRRSIKFAYVFMHANGTQLEKIASLLQEGKILPKIDKVFPLQKTPDAFAYSETGRAQGKIVIEIKNDERR